MTRLRRVHLRAGQAGETTSYWEDEWSRVDRAAEVAALLERPDPILRLLRAHVPEVGVVAELGAGASTYLAALRSPDRRLIGVDLAADAIRASATTWPDIAFVEGDVRRLPLRDASLDCVISLGVVEHLEEGPAAALEEHRRVLRPGGVALVSVPMVSGVRWVKDRWHLDLRRRDHYLARRRLVTNVAAPGPLAGPGRFHQYEYPVRAWRAELERAGFEVLGDHRHLVSAGIGELSLPSRRGTTSPPSERVSAEPVSSEPRSEPVSAEHGSVEPVSSGPTVAAPRRGDRVRRIVLAEQPETAWERAVCAVGQRALGHMVLSVARRR